MGHVAKCFTNDIVLGNHVLPPTQQYPKQTARVQLVTRNAALHIIGRKNKKLAKKLSNTLETGYAYVQGKRTFEYSYKQSPKLVVVDCPHKNTVKVANGYENLHRIWSCNENGILNS
ncbi:hypothetical protein TNCT_246551 [Trichonephila clavata]|uniref:Uncharacterized protein n=1 Tax=Trichonephila clavata TaxID=2740835 RepID=A0A8X6H4V0_TRICU|nr:hypothetical protein TNCT_246551 [Trichonephila clavata]